MTKTIRDVIIDVMEDMFSRSDDTAQHAPPKLMDYPETVYVERCYDEDRECTKFSAHHDPERFSRQGEVTRLAVYKFSGYVDVRTVVTPVEDTPTQIHDDIL